MLETQEQNLKSLNKTLHQCYHCAEDCKDEHIVFDEKDFCCEGCKMVYSLLNDKGLCDYYDLNREPLGSQIKIGNKNKFAVLDDADVVQKLVLFKNNSSYHVKFYTPQMHCSSCIWLLENLHKLMEGIIETRVDFARKEVNIVYDKENTSLRKIAEMLTSIGYEPLLNLSDMDSTAPKEKYNKKMVLRLGVAGFAFGNIMLMSFPEYFSLNPQENPKLSLIFSGINLLLGSVVFFYAAYPFFESAYKGIRKKFLNIDAPVSLAILITYLRSVFDILLQTGPGFMDSMAGIVFFMLSARFYQDFSQRKLSFDRDFKSFFPMSVTKISKEKEEPTLLHKLQEGDIIEIRNLELIPADGILIQGNASIDYSFVTGESAVQKHFMGELLYAGGRQVGNTIRLKLSKKVSQSYLTSLWEQNKVDFDSKKVSFVHSLAKYFTLVLLVLVAATAIYWAFVDPSKILNTTTAMLIIACPCSLLLAVAFTNGAVLNILARNGFFLRNPVVLESIADTNHIVFDKTGTLTHAGNSDTTFYNKGLQNMQAQVFWNMALQSVHPMSRGIEAHLRKEFGFTGKTQYGLTLEKFEEIPGKGLIAYYQNQEFMIGSDTFLEVEPNNSISKANVYLAVNKQIVAAFSFKNSYRSGIEKVLHKLKKHKLSLLSGDNDNERESLEKIFPKGSLLHFKQLPHMKKEFITQQQNQGNIVMMVGDGLNDAIAMAQSNVGIAVTEDSNMFSPACDGILNGKEIHKLPALLEFAADNHRIILLSFSFSLVYNTIGLFYAVQGLLSPLIAAILMPSMTVTIILLSSVSAKLAAKWRGL